MPLQKSSLNKRKRQKFEGQFRNIVKSAKKGAAAGAKGKAISGRMRKLSL